MPDKRSVWGMSLLECLILVVVLALLAALVYPWYEARLHTQRRQAAIHALQLLSERLETWHATRGTYSGAAGTPSEPADTGTPHLDLPDLPPDAERFYRLRIATGNERGFEIRAMPVGPQADDPCGTLSLTASGQRGVLGSDPDLTWRDCWLAPQAG